MITLFSLHSFPWFDLLAFFLTIIGIVIGLYFLGRFENSVLNLVGGIGVPLFSIVFLLTYIFLRTNGFPSTLEILTLSLDITGGTALLILLGEWIAIPLMMISEKYYANQRSLVEDDKWKRKAYNQITFAQIFYYFQVIFGLCFIFIPLALIVRSDWISTFFFGQSGAVNCLTKENIQSCSGSIEFFSNGCALRFTNFVNQIVGLVSKEKWRENLGILSDLADVIGCGFSVILFFVPAGIWSLIKKKPKQTKRKIQIERRLFTPDDNDLTDPRVNTTSREDWGQSDDDDWQGK